MNGWGALVESLQDRLSIQPSHSSVQLPSKNLKLKSIDEKWVCQFNFANISLNEIQSKQGLKILKLINCPDITETLTKLETEKVLSELAKTTHLFVIVFETTGDKILSPRQLSSISSVFSEERPLIIQQKIAGKKPLKFYKDVGSSEFTRIFDLKEVNKESFIEKMKSKETCNLYNLFEAFESNVFGSFNGNILETKIKKNKKTLHELCSKNALCLRFLGLFNSEVNFSESKIIDTEDIQILTAAFDLSFQTNIETEDENCLKKDIKLQLIASAAEQNNLPALKLLSKLENSSGIEEKVASIAWNLKRYDCLAELINSDSCFPNNFNANEIDLSKPHADKLKNVVEERGLFHNAIKRGSIEEIRNFMEKYSNVKIAYDTDNNAAIFTALKAKKFEVYSMLRSQGFSVSEVKETFSFINKLSDDEKDLIHESNKKYFTKSSESSHLFYILSKTRLGFNVKDREKSFEVIRKMLETLNEIPETQLILKVLEQSPTLQITFDFNNSHVFDMDPLSTENTMGICYNKIGDIFIGASNHEERFPVILGVLGHELCHFALELIYRNNCMPYEADDHNSIKKFDEILKNIKIYYQENLTSIDSIISTVFSYKKGQESELIVRVPQLLARYKDDSAKLVTLRSTYCQNLFDFFKENIVRDLKNNIKNVQFKTKINDLNELSGLLYKIWFSNLRLNLRAVEENKKILENSINQFTIIASNAPEITLTMIFQQLLDQFEITVGYLHLFLKAENITNSEFLTKVKEVVESDVKPKLIVDARDNNEALLEKLSTFSPQNRIFLVIHQQNLPNFNQSERKVIKIFHTWGDLREGYREKLLKTEISFQNCVVFLEDLFSPNLLCNFLPLHEISTNQLIKVDEQFDCQLENFFIDRRFQNSSLTVLLTLETLLKKGQEFKIVLISDITGTGKSFVLRKVKNMMKKLHPSSWIAFVDLRQHTNSFKAFQQEKSQEIKSFSDFLEDHILKHEKNFDRELFKELFSLGKVHVIFDGFDEISPYFNELVMKLFKAFDVKLGNQMWISTRCHLKQELEQNLKLFSCKILPLTSDEQVKFLIEMWKPSENSQTSVNFAKSLIDELSKTLSKHRTDLIGIPLLLRIIGEIYRNQESFSEKSLNYFAIFKAFVKKLVEIWVKRCNNEERGDILSQTSTLINIHHKIALQNIFGSDQNFVYSKQQWTNEKIARLGMIFYETINGDPTFIHETFADYLVSDYFCSNLENGENIEKISKILYEILTRKKYEIVRAFINVQIQNIIFDKKTFESFFKAFLAQMLKENNFQILFIIIEEKLKNLLDFILKLIAIDVEISAKIILSNSEENENIVMKAFSSKISSIFDNVWNFNKKTLPETEFKKICLDKSLTVGNLINYLLLSRKDDEEDEKIALSLLFKLKNTLSTNELKLLLTEESGENLWNSLNFGAANCKNIKVFNFFLELLKKVLDEEKLQEILFDCSDKCFLKTAVSSNTEEIVEIICKFLSANDLEDQKRVRNVVNELKNKLLLDSIANRDNEGVFTVVWNFMSEFLSSEEQQKLLQQKNSEERNFFHEVSIKCNEIGLLKYGVILKKVLFLEEETESLENIRKLLFDADDMKRNVLLLSAAMNGQRNCLKTLWEFATIFLSKEDQKILLNSRDLYGNSLLHLTAGFNNSSVIEDSIEIVKTNLPKEKFLEIIKSENSFGLTVIHILVMYNDDESAVEKMFSDIFDGDFLTTEEKLSILCQKESNFQRNIVAIAAKSNKNEKVVEVISYYLQKLLSSDRYEAFFHEVDFYHFNPFHLAIQYNTDYVVKSLCKIVKSQTSFRKTLLPSSNDCHKKVNIFHLNYNLLTVLWENLCDVVSLRELKSILLANKAFGYKTHLLYVYVLKNDQRKLKEYLKIAVTVFSDKELREILSKKTKKFNKSSLCFVASNTNDTGIVELMFELAKTVFSSQELKQLFMLKDTYNKNILHSVALKRDKKIVEVVMKALENLLREDELKKFLLERRKNGNSYFCCSAFNKRNSGVFQALYNFMKKYFSKSEIRKILEHLTNDKYTTFKVIWTCDNEHALKEFLEICEEIYTQEEQKELLTKNWMDSNRKSNYFCGSFQYNRNKNFLKILDEFARKLFAEDEYKSLIRDMDEKSRGIYKATCGNGEILNNDIDPGLCVII